MITTNTSRAEITTLFLQSGFKTENPSGLDNRLSHLLFPAPYMDSCNTRIGHSTLKRQDRQHDSRDFQDEVPTVRLPLDVAHGPKRLDNLTDPAFADPGSRSDIRLVEGTRSQEHLTDDPVGRRGMEPNRGRFSNHCIIQ